MQTTSTIQKLVVNAESEGFGDATILLHRFSAELREAQRRAQEMAESPTSFKKSKIPKIALLRFSLLHSRTRPLAGYITSLDYITWSWTSPRW
jgi:hypothetical protein